MAHPPTKTNNDRPIHTNSVHFAESNRIILVDPVTPEEKATVWWTASEYAQMKADIRRTLLLPTASTPANESIDESSNDTCMRGLEGKTRIGSSKKRQVREMASDAVLDLQYRHQMDVIWDPHSLAKVYVQVGFGCRQEAVDIAKADRAEVEQMYGLSATESLPSASSSSMPHSEGEQELMSKSDRKQKQQGRLSRFFDRPALHVALGAKKRHQLW